MKTALRLHTRRSYDTFPLGSTGFFLDTMLGRGLQGRLDAYDKFGEFYSPGQWIRFTVAHLGEGAFEFDTEKPTFGGHTHLTVGQASPEILSENELEWVIGVLRQYNTTNFEALIGLANENDEVFRVVAFLENARYWSLYQAQSIQDGPHFMQQQWLDAFEPFLQPVAV